MTSIPEGGPTVGHYRAANIPPKDAELIADLMALGLLVRDHAGRAAPVVIPPALVYAIVDILRTPYPQGTAKHWLNEFTPKVIPPKPRRQKAAPPATPALTRRKK